MRDEQGFADFGSSRREALRRQAYLLTGSAERAAQVTERALAETGRRWDRLGGPVAAEEHARRAVAAGALRERGRVPDRELSRVGTALPPADDDAGEAVWRALAGLPARRRGVLVLRYDEGLDDAAAAARLGISPALAAAEAEAGLVALRSVLRRRGAPEDLLPAALAGHPAPQPPGTATGISAGISAGTAAAESAGTTVGAAAGTGARVRTGAAGDAPGGPARRGRRGWLVAGAAVAALAVGAAVLVPLLRDGSPGAAGDPLPAAAGGPGELDWSARGALAGDEDLLRSALRTWRAGVPERQRPDRAAVLYAGSPDGARLVLLQGVDPTGQAWVAELADADGALALRTAEPLGRAVPLLAVGTGAGIRLLAPPGAVVLVRAADRPADRPLRTLTPDADGLSEPVTPPATGLPAVVVRDEDVLGSGSVRPGRLAAVTGRVEIGRPTLGLGGRATDVRPVWYGDGALVARRLGGSITIVPAGPVRSTAVRIGTRARRLDARAYEVVRGGTRYLASVIRVDGSPVCVDTGAAGSPAVLVSRCVPAGARTGVLHAVAGDGVRAVRARLAGKGAPSRLVTVAGTTGDGMSGLAQFPAALTAAARVEIRSATAVVTRITVPAYRGPRT